MSFQIVQEVHREQINEFKFTNDLVLVYDF